MTNRIYECDQLLVRRLQKDDWKKLYQWLTHPEVAKYYEGRDQQFTKEKIIDKFFQRDATTRCLVLYDNEPIGYIQYYRISNEYNYNETETVFGIDQFIGEHLQWNKGIGTKLVASMAEHLREHEGAQYVVLDPQVENVRAIRCYEKAGFSRKGLLKAHELHEGEWRDCLLMERDLRR